MRLGQSTTLCGRTITKHMASYINKIITGNYEHDGNAIIYGDTDSCYFSTYDILKEDIKKGMILILRVTPLAQKDVEKLRKVVEELYVIARDSNADIARLGEERIIVTPTGVKIWKPDYSLK